MLQTSKSVGYSTPRFVIGFGRTEIQWDLDDPCMRGLLKWGAWCGTSGNGTSLFDRRPRGTAGQGDKEVRMQTDARIRSPPHVLQYSLSYSCCWSCTMEVGVCGSHLDRAALLRADQDDSHLIIAGLICHSEMSLLRQEPKCKAVKWRWLMCMSMRSIVQRCVTGSWRSMSHIWDERTTVDNDWKCSKTGQCRRFDLKQKMFR